MDKFVAWVRDPKNFEKGMKAAKELAANMNSFGVLEPETKPATAGITVEDEGVED